MAHTPHLFEYCDYKRHFGQGRGIQLLFNIIHEKGKQFTHYAHRCRGIHNNFGHCFRLNLITIYCLQSFCEELQCQNLSNVEVLITWKCIFALGNIVKHLCLKQPSYLGISSANLSAKLSMKTNTEIDRKGVNLLLIKHRKATNWNHYY